MWQTKFLIKEPTCDSIYYLFKAPQLTQLAQKYMTVKYKILSYKSPVPLFHGSLLTYPFLECVWNYSLEWGCPSRLVLESEWQKFACSHWFGLYGYEWHQSLLNNYFCRFNITASIPLQYSVHYSKTNYDTV